MGNVSKLQTYLISESIAKDVLQTLGIVRSQIGPPMDGKKYKSFSSVYTGDVDRYAPLVDIVAKLFYGKAFLRKAHKKTHLIVSTMRMHFIDEDITARDVASMIRDVVDKFTINSVLDMDAVENLLSTVKQTMDTAEDPYGWSREIVEYIHKWPGKHGLLRAGNNS